jgi:hypothetical protein
MHNSRCGAGTSRAILTIRQRFAQLTTQSQQIEACITKNEAYNDGYI